MKAREDVAAMLRAGATYRAIKQQLHVSSDEISATRKALRIPLPRGTGRQYTPQEKQDIHARTAAMLRAGATYRQITAAIGINPPAIARIRRALGISSPRPRPQRARTAEETFTAHTQPYGDGHLRWTGPRNGRQSSLYTAGRRISPRRHAFLTHHGREPQGLTRPACGEPDCHAGAHLTDRTIRKQPTLDTLYDAIFGSDQ